jgi:hypothetical protein
MSMSSNILLMYKIAYFIKFTFGYKYMKMRIKAHIFRKWMQYNNITRN